MVSTTRTALKRGREELMASSLKDLQTKQVTVTMKEGKKRITPQLLSQEGSARVDLVQQPTLIPQKKRQTVLDDVGSGAIATKTVLMYHPRGRISRLRGASNVYKRDDIIVEIRSNDSITVKERDKLLWTDILNSIVDTNTSPNIVNVDIHEKFILVSINKKYGSAVSGREEGWHVLWCWRVML